MATQIAECIARAQAIIDHAATGIAFYEADGRCLEANESLARMVGATPQVLRNQNFRSLESWRTSGMLDHAHHVLETGEPIEHEAHLTTSFGADLWLNCRFSAAPIGGRRHLLLLAEDVSLRRRREQALVLRQWRLMEVHSIAKQVSGELTPSGAMQTTIDRLCPLVGADFGVMAHLDDTGVPSGQVNSSRTTAESVPLGTQLALRGVLRRIASGFVLHTANVALERDYVGIPDWHPEIGPVIGAPAMDRGKVLAVLLVGRRKGTEPFDDEDRAVVELLAGLTAVSIRVAERFAQLQELNQTLAKQANADSQTGLGDRRALELAVDIKHAEATRYGIGYGLLVADVEALQAKSSDKQTRTVDAWLADIASLLSRSVRSGDSVFRYGPEEIAVLLSHQSLTGVEAAGERLKKIIEGASVEQRATLPSAIAVSIGGTAFDPDSARSKSCTWQDVLRVADQALHDAKNRGASVVSIRGL